MSFLDKIKIINKKLGGFPTNTEHTLENVNFQISVTGRSTRQKKTFVLAVQNQQKGNLKVAENLYKKILKINPNYVPALNNYGNVIHGLGDLKKAKNSYEKAIKINPDLATAHNNLGIIWCKLKENKKAINNYEKAIKINPDLAAAHNNLGNTLKILGETQKAVNCYQKAIQIKPNYAVANNNLGTVLKALGMHQESIKYFQKANLAISRAQLLESTYFGTGLKNYKKLQKKLSAQDPLNRRISTIAAYVSTKENIKNVNPFCKNPLNFILTKNLKSELPSADKFCENLLKICTNKVLAIWEPETKATRFGYQSYDDLFVINDIEILKLKKMIEKQIVNYRKIYKFNEDHFITKWPRKSYLYGWYVKMLNQGYQEAHIHSTAWLSGVIYLKIPKFSSKNEGSIKLTLSGYDYPDDKNLPYFIHQPKVLDIILFPASVLHRTIPFNSQEARHCIAFDLIPK